MLLGRRFLLILATLIGGATFVLHVAGSAAKKPPPPMIEAFNEGPYGTQHSWKPSSATVDAGKNVNLANPTPVAHGVEWKSGPATPTCTPGVPVGTTPGASGANWSGTCTFPKPGVYTFYCTVHGPEMTATVTVNPAPPPTIKKLSPKKGTLAGGTSVNITGTTFTGAKTVMFGSVEATSFTVNSDTSITAVSPAEVAGTVDVRVTGIESETSAVSRRDHFKFK
jgi:plastocyanin